MMTLRLRTIAVLCPLLLAGLATAANQFPSFQPGLWSFTSTVVTPGSPKPEVRTLRKCVDPGKDIEDKWQSLAKSACRFSPVAHVGNLYSYTSACTKGAVTLQTKSSIYVESKTAYRVESEARTSDQMRRETIIAQRVGDCGT
jgi:Protein of unknown function (DUF3617)